MSDPHRAVAPARVTPRAATSPTFMRVEVSPKTIALAVLIPAAAWVLVKLLPVFLALVVALFVVGTLNPAVAWLERRGTSRGWSIALLFGAALISTLLVMALTIPTLLEQLSTLAKDEPRIRARLADAFGHSQLSAPLAEWLRNAHHESFGSTLAKAALAYSTRAFEIVTYVVSAVFLALYIMVDRDRLRGGLFALVPRSHHIRLSRILLNLEVIVGGYIRGQVLTSALMAVFALVLLAICRVPNALALAAFAGVADVLPYIGVFLSVGPAVIAALSKGPVTAGVVLVAMLAYEEFESRLLVPRVYGRALRLPSSVVLFALLVGGTLLGIAGALLALPLAAGVRMLIEELRVELPGEQVDDAAVRARDDHAEREYERRTEGVPAEQAAAIAVAMAEKRAHEEGGAEAATTTPISLSGEQPRVRP